MAIDFANQIINALSQYLPYTAVSIGRKYQAEGVAVATNKITITLSADDYTSVAGKINDVIKPNAVFSTSGFYLKNTILSFVAYPEDTTSFYAFEVGFSKPHKLKKGDAVSLKNFTNTTYNAEYTVLKITGSRTAILYAATTIPVITITSGLGFIPCQYTEGLNSIVTLTDEGSPEVSFTFDENKSFTVEGLSEIDLDYLPHIHDYSDHLKQMNFETFLRNLATSTTDEFLILDSKSLRRTASRSKNNKSDSSYSSYSRSGSFDSNYSLVLNYVLERNENDDNNQTDSGSDIVEKQTRLSDAITLILRTPLDSDDSKIVSAITISSEEASGTISEGRVVVPYTLDFVVTSLQSAVMDIEQKDSYPINSVKYGTNVVDFS